MIFRVYHRTIGGHVHIRFFAGRDPGLGKCGDLIMRIEEFAEFKRRSEISLSIEFVLEK